MLAEPQWLARRGRASIIEVKRASVLDQTLLGVSLTRRKRLRILVILQ